LAKRKNPRTPTKLQALSARLDALQPQQNGIRRPPRRWPALSAATLWRMQCAGLRHLIRRDPPFAERWLAMLEKAHHLEFGGLLSTGLSREDARAKSRRILEDFARLDRALSRLKHGFESRWGHHRCRRVLSDIGKAGSTRSQPTPPCQRLRTCTRSAPRHAEASR